LTKTGQTSIDHNRSNQQGGWLAQARSASGFGSATLKIFVIFWVSNKLHQGVSQLTPRSVWGWVKLVKQVSTNRVKHAGWALVTALPKKDFSDWSNTYDQTGQTRMTGDRCRVAKEGLLGELERLLILQSREPLCR
jgi:hypothetical protein